MRKIKEASEINNRTIMIDIGVMEPNLEWYEEHYEEANKADVSGFSKKYGIEVDDRFNQTIKDKKIIRTGEIVMEIGNKKVMIPKEPDLR